MVCWKGGRLKEGRDGRSSVQSRDTRSPDRISCAACFVVVGVSMFIAPNSSSFPYKPHALPGGPFLSKGRLLNGGRGGASDIFEW